MKILAIDTASSVCSVALLENDIVIDKNDVIVIVYYENNCL